MFKLTFGCVRYLFHATKYKFIIYIQMLENQLTLSLNKYNIKYEIRTFQLLQYFRLVAISAKSNLSFYLPVTKLQFSTNSANSSNTANKYVQKLRTLNWHVKYKNTQCCCVEFIFSLKSSRAEVAWFPGTLRCTHRRWNHLV